MTISKRYQVFVSSTLSDLVSERQKVISTVLMLDCFAASMEYFPATGEEQMAFVRKVIDDCDYYVLIIGGRYGSMHIEGKSFTELEFDFAVERKIPICAFLHKDISVLPPEKRDQDAESLERLEAFRSKVSKDRVVGYFNTADELSRDVTHCLLRQIKTFPGIGWSRGVKVADDSVYQELIRLRDENEQLSEQLEIYEADLSTVVGTLSRERQWMYRGVNNDIVHKTFAPIHIVHGILGDFIEGMFWEPARERIAVTMKNLIMLKGGQVREVVGATISEFLLVMMSEGLLERRYDANNKQYLIATEKALSVVRKLSSG